MSSWLKSTSVYHYPRRALKYISSKCKSNRAVFEEIYHRNLWGDAESVSGRGSSSRYTRSIRKRLPRLLRALHVRTLLDAPCGDFFWMRKVRGAYDRYHYTGCDIVPALISANERKYGDVNTEFRVLDVTRDELPRVDLILCRECLGHLPHKDSLAALRNFQASRSRFLLTTTYPRLTKNRPIIKGEWGPINLQLPPFDFPAPIEWIREWDNDAHEFGETCLGLWELNEAPAQAGRA